MILLTGSRGLIGRHIKRLLVGLDVPVREFDIKNGVSEDLRDQRALARALEGVTGIVHLGAVSRVVPAQQNPDWTYAVNVTPLRQMADRVREASSPPWLIFASSREVYGDSPSLPVSEDAELQPGNVYANSKLAGEQIVAGLAADGLVANFCRFSNVYGCPGDHADRVVPAFARAAAFDLPIRIDGAECLFDFTHVDDTVRGLAAMIEAASRGRILPPVHFVTGRGTTLGELAVMAQRNARGTVSIAEMPPRDCGATRFRGNPARAEALLGWTAQVALEDGFTRLVEAYSELGVAASA